MGPSIKATFDKLAEARAVQAAEADIYGAHEQIRPPGMPSFTNSGVWSKLEQDEESAHPAVGGAGLGAADTGADLGTADTGADLGTAGTSADLGTTDTGGDWGTADTGATHDTYADWGTADTGADLATDTGADSSTADTGADSGTHDINADWGTEADWGTHKAVPDSDAVAADLPVPVAKHDQPSHRTGQTGACLPMANQEDDSTAQALTVEVGDHVVATRKISYKDATVEQGQWGTIVSLDPLGADWSACQLKGVIKLKQVKIYKNVDKAEPSEPLAKVKIYENDDKAEPSEPLAKRICTMPSSPVFGRLLKEAGYTTQQDVAAAYAKGVTDAVVFMQSLKSSEAPGLVIFPDSGKGSQKLSK